MSLNNHLFLISQNIIAEYYRWKTPLKSDLKSKMTDALWFAETYSLFSRNIICESFEGQKFEIHVVDI